MTQVSGGFNLTGPAVGQVNLTCQIPSNVTRFTQSGILLLLLFVIVVIVVVVIVIVIV